MSKIDPEIRQYVEEHIIPRYAAFDKAHQADHVNMVIEQSMRLAAHEPGIDCDMAYVTAAFHDLGLINGRENHHTDSRKILESDEFIKAHFTPGQIRMMGEAVEDHRASKSGRPRNIYGLIVAEADRFIDCETIIRRTVQYGLKNYPALDLEGHYNRTIAHLSEKYGPDGYLKIWMPESDNAIRLEQLRRVIADKSALRTLFDRIFEEETVRSIRNIIFDFDGTLVDTAPLIIHTMQEAMRAMQLPLRTEAECRASIGLRLEEIPALLWSDRTGISEEYARTYRRIFDTLKRPLSVQCFPGVLDTIATLHNSGIRMAIASSRSHKSLEEYVSQFGLGDCFSMLIGGNDVQRGKPAPDPVLTILDTLGWDARETLTVGDATVDILMGKAAGTHTCAVTYGNGTESALASTHPDHIISDITTLRDIVNG